MNSTHIDVERRRRRKKSHKNHVRPCVVKINKNKTFNEKVIILYATDDTLYPKRNETNATNEQANGMNGKQSTNNNNKNEERRVTHSQSKL